MLSVGKQAISQAVRIIRRKGEGEAKNPGTRKKSKGDVYFYCFTIFRGDEAIHVVTEAKGGNNEVV